MVINQEITDQWAAYHGDCIEVIKEIPSNSIHYSVFSPPFSSLFTYSASERDMGNSTDAEFYDHFKYLIPELYRIIMPGRLLSFHCSDIPAMKERDGYMGLKDFPGILLKEFEKAGFIYHSRVTIWKDPLIEAVRTKSLRLVLLLLYSVTKIDSRSRPNFLLCRAAKGLTTAIFFFCSFKASRKFLDALLADSDRKNSRSPLP